MYLSTIKDNDIGFNKYNTVRQSRSLFTGDIVGKKRHVSNNRNFNLKNNDIEKSQPRKLNQPLNKAYYHLRNDDIEGSKPCMNKFKTKRNPSNPLNPKYVLPSYDELEPINPKFIRDTLNIDDIKGSKPKTFIKTKKPRRNINDISDIEGARPKKEYMRKQMLNPLNVKDINEFRIFRTSRVTNPLDPEYVVSSELANMQERIGKIEGSQSRQLHPKEVNRVVGYSLMNEDIHGSKPGTTGNPYIKEKNRKNFRNINRIDDIPGAQSSTLKKGMKTKRCLNPLVPDYSYPGHVQDIEYIKSLYDPHYKKESKSIGIVGAIGKRGKDVVKSEVIAEKKEAEPPQQDTGIPMPDYQFDSLVQGQENVSEVKKEKDISPVVETKNHNIQESKVLDDNMSRSQKSGKDVPPKRKKKKDFVVKRRKSKKPLHKRIDKEKYDVDRHNFYGVDAKKPNLTKVQDNINVHYKKIQQFHEKSTKKVQPKLTKLQQFDQFMNLGF